MSEERTCGEREALVTYLYGEADPAARARFEGHLLACGACRQELDALRGVRARLADWRRPDQAVGFRLVRDPVVVPFRRRWYTLPAWAQAAAAVLLLAGAAAVANLDVRYGKDGLVVRTGWQKPEYGGQDHARQLVGAPGATGEETVVRLVMPPSRHVGADERLGDRVPARGEHPADRERDKVSEARRRQDRSEYVERGQERAQQLRALAEDLDRDLVFLQAVTADRISELAAHALDRLLQPPTPDQRP
jgi:hypothetical protein